MSFILRIIYSDIIVLHVLITINQLSVIAVVVCKRCDIIAEMGEREREKERERDNSDMKIMRIRESAKGVRTR